jgi:hypothetical protein
MSMTTPIDVLGKGPPIRPDVLDLLAAGHKLLIPIAPVGNGGSWFCSRGTLEKPKPLDLVPPPVLRRYQLKNGVASGLAPNCDPIICGGLLKLLERGHRVNLI